MARLVEGATELNEETAKYATRVLRLEPGAPFVAFDPELAIEADGSIVKVDRRAVVVSLGEPRPAARPPREVTLVQGIGKGDKLDAIVRDATELGATRIIPALAERSVRRPEAKPSVADARLRRIAIEAARQCGRGDTPRIDGVTPLLDALQAARPGASGLAVALHPDGPEPLGAALADLDSRAPVALVIGPEGGLSPRELEVARELGYAIAHLGTFVLRTETACAAALGALLAAPGPRAPRQE